METPSLASVDLSRRLKTAKYETQLVKLQDRLLHLRLELGGQIGGHIGPPLLILFEGWDAAGKGGCIRRLVEPLDPRHFSVFQYQSPTPREKRHHFLWRFWPSVPGRGGMCVFDRTWYGRVLVERVEGFCSGPEWKRAYGEIRMFEELLTSDQTILVKFFLHVSSSEQRKRFERRSEEPLKQWKLTEEDWRNRAKRQEYEAAVDDMLRLTHTENAPWSVVSAENKRWGRIQVVKEVIRRLENYGS